MIIIAVINGKGGVGKSTLTSALAVKAASEGKRIAVVDMDPQRSLVEWWARRGKTDNPSVYEGAASAEDAIEGLAQVERPDVVFMDGLPGNIGIMTEMVEAADLVLIPVKASMIDLLATQDAVTLARDSGTPFLVIINDVHGREKLADAARQFLFTHDLPIAETQIAHRVSYVHAMTVGKSAAEVNSGRDKAAAEEISALWKEVQVAAVKAVRAKKKEAAR